MNPSQLIAELQRRRVFRVAVAYAAVGFVTLEAADLLLPRLGVPEWVLSAITVMAVIGFVIAIALAWAFDVTPDGVRRTAPLAAHDRDVVDTGARLSGRRLIIVVLVLLGGAVGAGLLFGPRGGSATPPLGAVDAPGARSIAVLPFDDHSPAKDQEWFSDGLTEEILNSLARLDEIQVTARNSSFVFRDSAVDVREVGRRLGVANVLEGSIRRVDNRLRITAQLIRASDGFHLWSHAYERHLDDVFAVQMDIAENIARVMDIYLDDARRERLKASGTRDAEAFLHYLRGRADYAEAHRLGVGATDLLWQANDWFERAIALDSTFALAHFYHHDAFSHAVMGDLRPPARFTLADGSPDIDGMLRLIKADLDAGQRHAGDGSLARSLRVVSHYGGGEWDGLPRAMAALGDDELIREVEIAGGGWLWFPMMLMRAEERAMKLSRWRLQRDPLDVNSWSDVIQLERLAGNLREAERLLEQAAAAGIRHRYIDEPAVFILLEQGRARDVLTRFAGNESASLRWWAAAMAHAELGDVASARAAMDEGRRLGGYSERICWILARIGDQAAANDCVRDIDAAPRGWIRLSRMIVDHGSVPFDPHAAPRFTAMHASMGTPPWPRTKPAPALRSGTGSKS
jgi:adenylate cyclase